MKNYIHTGQYYYEPSEVENHGTTIAEETFELLELKSDENLCDRQSETCEGDKFYTDDQWVMTHWCKKHFDELVADGTFSKAEKA